MPAKTENERRQSRALPMLTDTLGTSLNDRLLFAVPKSEFEPYNQEEL